MNYETPRGAFQEGGLRRDGDATSAPMTIGATALKERAEKRSFVVDNRQAKTRNKTRNNRGFTLIETSVVLSIIILITIISASVIQNARDNYALSAASEEILSTLRLSRSKTLGSQDSSRFGVHFAEDRIVVFKGSTYVDGDASNQIVILPSRTTISSINLGGPVDIIFSRLTGVASVGGNITASLKSNPSKNQIITILSSGVAYSQ